MVVAIGRKDVFTHPIVWNSMELSITPRMLIYLTMVWQVDLAAAFLANGLVVDAYLTCYNEEKKVSAMMDEARIET